jgi:hypothetical protein
VTIPRHLSCRRYALPALLLAAAEVLIPDTRRRVAQSRYRHSTESGTA